MGSRFVELVLPLVAAPTIYMVTIRHDNGVLAHRYTAVAPSTENQRTSVVLIDHRHEFVRFRALPDTLGTTHLLMTRQVLRIPALAEVMNGPERLAYVERDSFRFNPWDNLAHEAFLFDSVLVPGAYNAVMITPFPNPHGRVVTIYRPNRG